MKQRFNFVTVDTILSKFLRDYKGLEINEDEAIEWIGEALGFMQIASVSEEAVAFLEVKGYHAQLPNGLQHIIQLARDNQWCPTTPEICAPVSILEEIIPPSTSPCTDCNTPVVVADCQGHILGDYEIVYYRPYYDLKWEFSMWYSYLRGSRRFTPIRLANHSFFNTLVCSLPNADGLYTTSRDEYTVVADHLRFSFETGFVALSYLRQVTDPDTGYPLIPDDESCKAAITYYLGWKSKEREGWNHREGAMQLAQLAEQRWLKYVKQFKNKAKMPSGVDEYQNLKDQSLYLLPNQKRYYGYFGKLAYPEDKVFNDPNLTNKFGFAGYTGNPGYLPYKI